MTAILVQAGNLTVREIRAVLRQPAFVAITLVQPLIWLLLFGQLFQRIVEIPGFGSDSYLVFMTPGLVVMTALFSSVWTGMGLVDEMESGVMDRLLVSPTHRGAILTGKLAQTAVGILIQTAIVFLLALGLGARFPGGLAGAAVTAVAALLFAAGVGSFSNIVALLLRERESIIGVSQFLVMPLSFLSSALMASGIAPGWIRTVARFNPVDWAVSAGRDALSADPDWGGVLGHLGYLAVVALALAYLATRAFRAYQRSL
jgi:ABC-2 type transport system permease protein